MAGKDERREQGRPPVQEKRLRREGEADAVEQFDVPRAHDSEPVEGEGDCRRDG